jgi:hypothetical protein
LDKRGESTRANVSMPFVRPAREHVDESASNDHKYSIVNHLQSVTALGAARAAFGVVPIFLGGNRLNLSSHSRK